jgi:hypothetical protein
MYYIGIHTDDASTDLIFPEEWQFQKGHEVSFLNELISASKEGLCSMEEETQLHMGG